MKTVPRETSPIKPTISIRIEMDGQRRKIHARLRGKRCLRTCGTGVPKQGRKVKVDDGIGEDSKGISENPFRTSMESNHLAGQSNRIVPMHGTIVPTGALGG